MVYDFHQFDCSDSSRNTTSLPLVLDQLNLLRHHDVDLPEARGFFLDGRPPHDHGCSRRREQRHQIVNRFLDRRLRPGLGNHAAGAWESLDWGGEIIGLSN